MNESIEKDVPEPEEEAAQPERPNSVPWPSTDSAEEAARILLDELEEWIVQSIERHKDTPWQGVHDEGSFASSWFGFLLIRHRDDVVAFLRSLRESYREWAQTHYLHGYYPRHEVHHGPENVLYFQTRFASLNMEDVLTIDILDDVVHHVGNWTGGIPDWFDWKTRMFRSVVLGTREVDPAPTRTINIAEHFRFVLLATAAYRLSRERRYFDWAEIYTGQWLEAFAKNSKIPIALHPTFSEAELEQRYSAVRSSFLGAAPSDVGRDVNRLEAHVANGTIDALIDLFSLTGKDVYRTWACRLCRSLVPTVAEAQNHPAGLLLMKYRSLTGDESLDDEIMSVVQPAFRADDVCEYWWDPAYSWSKEELIGPGKRADMIRWMKRGNDNEWSPDDSPTPSALMLAYQISGEKQYARRSLELACARLRVARLEFPDGRKHGCADRTVSAVVRGNGRCHNAGNVTGSLYPYAANVFDLCSIPTRVETVLSSQPPQGTNDTPGVRS